jgi:hypothetical protein
MMSDSFAGISPLDAPAFIGAELVGALLGLLIYTLLTWDQHQGNSKNE